MITVKAYLYPNTAEVQIFDPAIFITRNRQVYSRPIKVYQGVDNPIQVVVKNQDQKKVDLTGYTMQAQIQDPNSQVTVNTYAVVFADISTGLGSFTLDKETIDSLEQRFYKLTFRTINVATNADAPVYVDDNYGVPLDLEILPAYYAVTEAVPGVDETVFDGGTL